MKAGRDSGRALEGERDRHCWDSFKPFVIWVRAEPCTRACRWVFVMREKVAVGSPSQQGKFNKTYLTFATRRVSQWEKGQKKRGTKRPHRLKRGFSGKVILFGSYTLARYDVWMVLMWAGGLRMVSASLLRSLVWVWINPADFLHVFFLWFIFNNQQCCISKTFFMSSQTPSLSALLHPPS